MKEPTTPKTALTASQLRIAILRESGVTRRDQSFSKTQTADGTASERSDFAGFDGLDV
jgi:hypothetical protein